MGNRVAVHLTLRWGDVLLRTTRLSPPRAFVLGEGGDWDVPVGAIGADRLVLPTHTWSAGSRSSTLLGALAVDAEVTGGDDEPRFPRLAAVFAPLGHQAG